MKRNYKLKKFFLIATILLSLAFSNSIRAQKSDFTTLFNRFLRYYNSGDMLNAEKALTSIIESEIPLNNDQRIAVYNNLDVISSSLGNFDKALEYSLKAESYIRNNDKNSLVLAVIFNNRGHLFNIKRSYDVAIEYLEKSIRIFQNLGKNNITVLDHLSYSYINISIAYYETKNYSEALRYLEMNVKLTSEFNLSGLPLTFLSLAKIYVRTGDLKKAEEFFIKSISGFTNEYNNHYYRLAEVYFDYGLLLLSEGRIDDALAAHRNSLSISLKNYGEKHTLVSLSYKHIGDDYFKYDKLDSALFYFQKSLIAVNISFNNSDIFSNPSIDSSLFDIRLLDNLKAKAQALELLASEQNDRGTKLKMLNMSLETMDLALQLIDRIRNNYMSEESRIYLAENEKETYLFATHLAYSLYSLTNDKSMGYKMYGIAQKAKAAILRNEITGNELLYSAGIPDSLREKQKNLSGDISAYNNLVLEESRQTNPDSNKINLWKDALFDMNREKEKVTADIESVFPRYHDLIRKTEPVSLQQIQKELKKDETIVDYLLSNKYSDGKRKLYIFLISRDNLDFTEESLDSLFVVNADIIRRTFDPSLVARSKNGYYAAYTGALNQMYLNLLKPVEGQIKAKRLIIIPDEEIGWLPFDAFLKNKPAADQTDYEGLHFLIQEYTFSYGYSSSLIFSKGSTITKGAKVLAFSPDYFNNGLPGNGLSSLRGAGTEIGSVFKWFKGKSFIGRDATRENFMQSLSYPAIFHLAMHSLQDSTNSRYSCLMFDNHNPSVVDARLYNYEISLSRIKSPMVVLSACNSGTGTLYYGEGLMSLARGFTLAGASSVIKTAWEINDETSKAIITRFYYYLSKGKEKNVAMRLAKLEYLKDSPPAFTNPYFWAAYEVLGDNAPVVRNPNRSVLILSLTVLVVAGMFVYYLRRRRIFSDRSL